MFAVSRMLPYVNLYVDYVAAYIIFETLDWNLDLMFGLQIPLFNITKG